jgi:hypothetical protein
MAKADMRRMRSTADVVIPGRDAIVELKFCVCVEGERACSATYRLEEDMFDRQRE